MKVLRIYDHLGELKKEFNIYVEGEDFKWQSSYPEPLWLGTIALGEAGKEPEAEPTPEPEPEVYQGKTYEEGLQEAIETTTIQDNFELAKKVEEVKHESKKNGRKRSRVKGTSPSDYLRSVKVIRQDDPSGNAPERN
uniref:Uncharacterized protein n=1 Tax=viral metagenome TaxID=1070528 RepID=A0A6M3IDN9_9ZZZZ